MGNNFHNSSSLYLGFFQFVHNVRIRGKGLFKPLLQLLVA